MTLMSVQAVLNIDGWGCGDSVEGKNGPNENGRCDNDGARSMVQGVYKKVID